MMFYNILLSFITEEVILTINVSSTLDMLIQKIDHFPFMPFERSSKYVFNYVLGYKHMNI